MPNTEYIVVDASLTICRLIQEEDTDGDKKITVDDPCKSNGRGDKKFDVIDINNHKFAVEGTYYLANLLQELKLAESLKSKIDRLYTSRIFEKPAQRISRMIRQVYWPGLTRQIDEVHLLQVLKDPKLDTDKIKYLYVPNDDEIAFNYFSNAVEHLSNTDIKVIRLPANTDANWVKQLDDKHGPLTLGLIKMPDGNYRGVPYVVPGGRFNEMYGWDSYFESLGLLQDGKIELAKGMVDNFCYEINHYGKILNANRTYYLTRSQPPFLTSMIRAVYEKMPKSQESKLWLKESLCAAIKEYQTVWTSGEHLTRIGLSRYYGYGKGQPPEVESGHFDEIYKKFAERYGMKLAAFKKAYNDEKLTVHELDAYFINDRSMRESGYDTTFRWDDRCADFATVDLNSLLYKIECDISLILQNEFGGTFETGEHKIETAAEWLTKAQYRKKLMNEYLWDDKYGMFLDYDLKNNCLRYYLTPAVLYPLWAELADKQQAEQIIKNSITKLAMAGGLAASSKESNMKFSNRVERQWEYPNGWPPHQILAWQALINYGYDDIAERLTYKWLYTITVNVVNYNGTIPEKYNVVTRSHRVFTEYGNVGTEFDYITQEGFGWMNASYQVGISRLPTHLTDSLNLLIPPEWLWPGNKIVDTK
ncbi:MAG: hypothetical protein A2Y12_12485 [Planctomycetes bacterium GWF2_42_9]|nr:MAG: hypothetical protein A2Y12_12485 [Planctomycetes bacterium GWF2_42_9]